MKEALKMERRKIQLGLTAENTDWFKRLFIYSSSPYYTCWARLDAGNTARKQMIFDS